MMHSFLRHARHFLPLLGALLLTLTFLGDGAQAAELTAAATMTQASDAASPRDRKRDRKSVV